MSTGAEKATEYGVESLKIVFTVAAGALALTATFLKDLVQGEPRYLPLAVASWISLVIAMISAWYALASAVDRLGGAQAATAFAFAREGRCGGGLPDWLSPLSWFLPFWSHWERNPVRRCAAAAQHYLVLGLVLITVFATLNLPGFGREDPGTPGPASAGADSIVELDRMP